MLKKYKETDNYKINNIYFDFPEYGVEWRSSAGDSDYDQPTLDVLINGMDKYYGMMGFDMGYYFLRGLSRYGDFFEQRQGEMQLQPVQHPFRFVGGSGDEGYTNRAIQLVHYTPDQKVEQIR